MAWSVATSRCSHSRRGAAHGCLGAAGPPHRPLRSPRPIRNPQAVWSDGAEPYHKTRAEARRQDAVIFFGKESSMRTTAMPGAPGRRVGRTRAVPSTGTRMEITIISAVSPRGDRCFRVGEGTMDAAHSIVF
jgi:hypothetical protein